MQFLLSVRICGNINDVVVMTMVLMLFFMWRTEFRDPGVIDPTLELSADSVANQFLDLNPIDLEHINVTFCWITNQG